MIQRRQGPSVRRFRERFRERFRAGHWTAIPGLLTLAVGAIALSAYSGASSSQGNAPEQPIRFPHSVHVAKLGMNCVYCHYSAYKSPDPGLPALSTCMGCHTIVGPDRPKSDLGPARKSAEIEKLWKYADISNMGKNAKPIPWVRVHKLPEYVHFPHMRHVNAGVTCQTCHGQVQTMLPVAQAAPLNMGWCVNCHVNGYSAVDGKIATGWYQKKDGSEATAGTPASDLVPVKGAPAASPPIMAMQQDSATSPDQFTGSYLAGGVHKNGRRYARYDCANCHY